MTNTETNAGMTTLVNKNGFSTEVTDSQLDAKLDALMNDDIVSDFEDLQKLEKAGPVSVKTSTGWVLTETGKKAVELRISLKGTEEMDLYQVGGLKAVKQGFVSRSRIFRGLKSRGHAKFGQ